jgi:hypothetical protein
MRVHTPPRFLRLIVHSVGEARGHSGLCAGYERGEWRADKFAQHIIDWIPDFALSSHELADIHAGNLMGLVRRASRAIYETEKYKIRGEFGEIILHALMRDVFNSVPAIKKIYFQDGSNEVIKGFDAVHVVENALELWLGESKFYDDVHRAIRDVITELQKHLGTEYLRREFAAITNKLDRDWFGTERLRLLLREETSLDEVFACVRIPVLLTYDSRVVGNAKSVTQEYETAFLSEVSQFSDTFAKRLGELEERQGFTIRVHLFLIPLKAKKELLEHLDRRLRAAQGI